MSTKRASRLTIVNDTDDTFHKQVIPKNNNNTLKLKLDSLKTFAPLTDNQKIFYVYL